MDLLSIDSLTDAQIRGILERGEQWFERNRAGTKSVASLAGRIVFNVFYENSTRTAMSFATATHRLGASAVSLSVEQDSPAVKFYERNGFERAGEAAGGFVMQRTL